MLLHGVYRGIWDVLTPRTTQNQVGKLTEFGRLNKSGQLIDKNWKYLEGYWIEDANPYSQEFQKST